VSDRETTSTTSSSGGVSLARGMTEEAVMCSPQRPLAIAVVSALALASCSTSTASIERVWQAPAARVGQLTRVVTMFPSPEGALRFSAEDMMAARLVQHGMMATPAYSVLTRDDLQSRERAAAKLRAEGFDGVVAMRVVDATQTLEYYPSFDVYWGAAWGSVIPRTVIRVQIDAYRLDGMLVWSAMSKSVDPTGFTELVDDVTKVASEELQKAPAVIARR
jgi:hypothetical protein